MSREDFESNGTHCGYPVYCPNEDITCPYIDEEGLCHISDSIEECDDFRTHWINWKHWESWNIEE